MKFAPARGPMFFAIAAVLTLVSAAHATLKGFEQTHGYQSFLNMVQNYNAGQYGVDSGYSATLPVQITPGTGAWHALSGGFSSGTAISYVTGHEGFDRDYYNSNGTVGDEWDQGLVITTNHEGLAGPALEYRYDLDAQDLGMPPANTASTVVDLSFWIHGFLYSGNVPVGYFGNEVAFEDSQGHVGFRVGMTRTATGDKVTFWNGSTLLVSTLNADDNHFDRWEIRLDLAAGTVTASYFDFATGILHPLITGVPMQSPMADIAHITFRSSPGTNNYKLFAVDDFAFSVYVPPCPTPVCSPCDLNGDGRLGYEDEIMFYCQIAGNGCCGCGDFDQDGDCGTDADHKTFFACMENPASPCIRAVNDFCGTATDLGTARGAFPFDTRYASSSISVPPQTEPRMWNEVWYKWTCEFTGTTRVTAASLSMVPNALSVHLGAVCPVTPDRLVVSGDGAVEFQATAGASYLIRVGNWQPASVGHQGQLYVQSVCPRGTSPVSAMYLLTGPGTGLNWSWLIRSPTSTFVELENRDVLGANTTFAVAQRFAASINAQSAARPCTTSWISAKAINLFGIVLLSVKASEPFELWVNGPGFYGAQPGGCRVKTTLPHCSFNPEIYEVPGSGQDCNANGWDDAIDIAFGDSPDTNTNGVPDECDCDSADFDCDGDSGTDQDIEAFFSCLAGNCPAAPCTSSSDFNHDGDFGTDADIESFFRVLSGNPC